MIDRRFEAIENDENQELSKMLACSRAALDLRRVQAENCCTWRLRAAQTRVSSSQERKSPTVAVAVLLRDCWRAHPEADSTANLDPARHGCGGHRWLVE